jgi:hypothetical protein
MSDYRVSPETTRYDGDPGRVAIILPGVRYTPAAPLLHYARAVLLARGWTVQEIWWGDAPGQGRAEWVREHTLTALARENAQELLLVGKSLGTLAAPVAAERGLPAVWLTPLLTEPAVVDALTRASRPRLLVGGTADPLWQGDVARRTGADLLEVPGADHGMEVDSDPVRSAEILREVTVAMERFVGGLAGRV